MTIGKSGNSKNSQRTQEPPENKLARRFEVNDNRNSHPNKQGRIRCRSGKGGVETAGICPKKKKKSSTHNSQESRGGENRGVSGVGVRGGPIRGAGGGGRMTSGKDLNACNGGTSS